MSRPLLIAMFTTVVLSTAVLQYREVDRLVDRRQAAAPLERGVEAPPLAVERLDGDNLIDREDFTDRIVILTFWASWCLPCRAEMPELARFVSEWNHESERTRDALFVAVNLGEDPDDIRSVTEDPLYRDVLFGLDPDGEAAARWRASALPSTYVIDPDGKVVDVMRGYDTHLSMRLRGVLREHRSRVAW